MPTDRQLDDRISKWLAAEAPMQLPDRVLRATFERTRRTRQEASWQQVLRSLQMNRMIFGLGGAAVVVLAAVLALGIYINNPGSGVGEPPSPSPTTEAPSPSTEPSPNPTSAPTTKPTATPEPTSRTDAGLPQGSFDFVEFPDGMPMAVTIPAPGWRFREQTSLFSKGDEYAEVPEAWITLQSNTPGTAFYVPGDPCRVNSTKPQSPATTVGDFVADLAAQDSGDASEPVDVTVGGYAGKSITLHVPDDAVVEECEEGFFVRYGYAENPVWHNNHGPGQIDELWILDVDGSVVVLAAMYRPDTSEELVEETRAIVESTTFGTP